MKSRFDHIRRVGTGVLAFCFLVSVHGISYAVPPAPDAGSLPLLAVTFKPAAPDAKGNVNYIDVTVAADVGKVDANQPLLYLPLTSSNVQSIASDVIDLVVADTKGAIPLKVRDDPENAQSSYRRWLTTRPVEGRITVHYRAPITNALNPRGAAPPLELRTEDGAFSGAASTFLILPQMKTAYRTDIHWDLSAMPAGAVGMSTYGVGDIHLDSTASAELLAQGYFFGGKIHRYPSRPAANGFFSAWQGTPPFDAEALMHWTEQLYDYYFDYFKPGKAWPYAVLLRRNLINAGGGVEVGGSFIGTFGADTKAEPLKLTLAHEMVHTFIGALDGGDELAGSWFSEGIAVYYERLLPLRSGQITPNDFLQDLNTTAGRYYTDALIHAPNSDIPLKFWADTRIRVLPYDRGSLYFAVVDSQVRKASGGKRSLDDLVFAMIERRNHRLPMDQATWLQILTQELGPAGQTGLQAMLNGEVMLPDSDAFGPCFARTTKPLRRYELGFDSRVLMEPSRIVRGLVSGSAAERAGLRNGDQIVKPVPQDGIQANQTEILHLEIKRDGKVFSLSYLPRGETVQAYQWERVAGVPDSDCLLPFHKSPASGGN
jgi:hypothetical protein